MNGWVSLLADRSDELWLRTGEHLTLTGVSTGLAVIIGVPLGILALRLRSLRGTVMGAVGILQTIPSLALLAILLATFQKIGAVPAIVALTLYALLPIVRNTLAGLEGVPAVVNEAARGIGMTDGQRLRLVELPLALPVIIAGIRTAAVVNVGIATLSAFIGAGGLGQFINRGLALSNTDLILLGAIPAALLALVVDGTIAVFQWGFQRRRSDRGWSSSRLGRALRPLALAAPALLVLATGLTFIEPSSDSADPTITIGTKNFTEQLILGEIIAQLVEDRTTLEVERRFNLGGTMICQGALRAGEIDLYVEYTGTALTAILERPVIVDPERAHEAVSRAYREKYALEWTAPLGFDNTYALTVRRDDAASNRLETVSDLVDTSNRLTAGFTAEFSERPDGYPGLRRAYGLRFKEIRDLDPALMYQAIADHEVDVICAFATDGRIAAHDLQPLRDDRGFFPPYQAAPVIRASVLRRYPELSTVLSLLANRIDEVTMRKLNTEVDAHGRSPSDVAGEFLRQAGLVRER